MTNPPMAYCPKCQWTMEQLAAKCPACGFQSPAARNESFVQYTLRDVLVLFAVVAVLLTLWNAARKPYLPMFQADFAPTRVQYLSSSTIVDGQILQNGDVSERQLIGRRAAKLGFANFGELTEIVVRNSGVAEEIQPHLCQLAHSGALKNLRRLSLPSFAGADRVIKQLQADLPECQIYQRRGRTGPWQPRQAAGTAAPVPRADATAAPR